MNQKSLKRFPVILKVDANISMSRFEVGLNEDQYDDLLLFSEALTRHSRQQIHKHLRYGRVCESRWIWTVFTTDLTCFHQTQYQKQDARQSTAMVALRHSGCPRGLSFFLVCHFLFQRIHNRPSQPTSLLLSKDVHKKNEIWSWEFFKKRRVQRQQYLALYGEYARSKSPSKELEVCMRRRTLECAFFILKGATSPSTRRPDCSKPKWS